MVGLSTPLPSCIKQRLLILYRAISKIMHTQWFMALSPNGINSIDSTLDATCRKIWYLPKGLSTACLHAPQDELYLNLSPVWEDYCSAATNSWTQIYNDDGALGATTRASLYQTATEFKQCRLNLNSMPIGEVDHSTPPYLSAIYPHSLQQTYIP
jgi:hypothetical protein